MTEGDYRVYVLFAIVGYIGAPVHLLLIPYFAAIGAPWLAALNVASCAAWTYSLIANRAGRHHIAIMLVTVEVFAHSLVAALTLGLSLGFQHYLWGGLTFIMLNDRLGKRSIVAITTGLGTTFVFLSLFAGSIDYRYRYASMIPYVHTTNVVIAFVASALAAYHFRTSSRDAEREFERLASIDALTGLYNRRQLTAEIDKRLALAARENLALSLVLVDIDHFKAVNDTLGHDAGDAVLRAVANRLAQRLRKSDLVGRWGGEEFLLLLHGPHVHARSTAERLRHTIAAAPVTIEGRDVSITATLGVAPIEPGETLESCTRRADIALYRGKRDGRDQVVVHDDSRAAAEQPSDRPAQPVQPHVISPVTTLAPIDAATASP